MPSKEEQVAEVQLIQASTSQEEFQWRGSTKEKQSWEALIAGEEVRGTVSPLAFALRLIDNGAGFDLWLNVNYKLETSEGVQLTLQGPKLTRSDLDRIKRVIDERYEKASKEGFDNVVFDVYTAVQAYLTEVPVETTSDEDGLQPDSTNESLEVNRDVHMSRVVFWTHHLKAPSKKRDMTAWCSELNLWGLVKSGYPGYLCFEGQEDDIQEIVRRIKSLQWHAITVKTEERYTHQAPSSCLTMGEVRQDALQQCLLAKGHSANVTKEQGAGSKLRTTMDEVESRKELVERLKTATIPEDEYMFALNLRKG